MGSVSNARAVYGLTASGTPVGTNVNGSLTVGTSQTAAPFSSADIAYSFKVTNAGGTGTATLDIGTGVVTAAGATPPTVADGDGKDFEGVTLPALVTFNAILFIGGAQGCIIEQSDGGGGWNTVGGVNTGAGLLFFSTTGDTSDLDWRIGTVGSTAGEMVTVTVIGKST